MKCKLKLLLILFIIGSGILLNAQVTVNPLEGEKVKQEQAQTEESVSENQQELFLYTPFTKVSVPPGESVTYNIKLINKGQSMKNLDISVTGLSSAWETEIKSGSYNVTQLSVMPDKEEEFRLTVKVPLKVNRGTYSFVVHAGNEVKLPLSVIVTSQGTFKTEFTTNQPNMQGTADSKFNFNATLSNKTPETQLFALMATAPTGWNVIFKVNGSQATSAQVEPEATQNVSIEITPPVSVEAGSYTIPIRVTTGTTSDGIELEVVVTGKYEMQFTTPTGLLSSDITAGKTKRVDLVVKNTGSAELKGIELTSGKPEGWEVSFEPIKIETLKAGEVANAQAIIKTSNKALPGDYMININAKTPEVDKSISFRMTVKTSAIWGWTGIGIIVIVIVAIYFLFRKYGRR